MVTISEIENSGDSRGARFAPPWPEVSGVGEVHIAEILPGAVRGNHFHRRRFETLLVFSGDRWSLLFDNGEGTAIEKRTFTSPNAVMIRIDPMNAHAVVNEGNSPLWICSMGDTPDDGEHPDTFRRVLA